MTVLSRSSVQHVSKHWDFRFWGLSVRNCGRLRKTDPPHLLPLQMLDKKGVVESAFLFRARIIEAGTPGLDTIVKAEIMERIPVQKIAERFEPRTTGEVPYFKKIIGPDDYPPDEDIYAKYRGDFCLIDQNWQGDDGAWFLCHQRDGKQTVVLAGDWGWHGSSFYAGNRLLSDTEWKRIASRTVDLTEMK